MTIEELKQTDWYKKLPKLIQQAIDVAPPIQHGEYLRLSYGRIFSNLILARVDKSYQIIMQLKRDRLRDESSYYYQFPLTPNESLSQVKKKEKHSDDSIITPPPVIPFTG